MPWQRERYPPDWEAIALQVKERSGWKCERCGAVHGQPHPLTGSIVVLTTAHVGPTKHDKHDITALVAMCQRCHIREDADEHRDNARVTRTAKRLAQAAARGQLPLWGKMKRGEE